MPQLDWSQIDAVLLECGLVILAALVLNSVETEAKHVTEDGNEWVFILVTSSCLWSIYAVSSSSILSNLGYTVFETLNNNFLFCSNFLSFENV